MQLRRLVLAVLAIVTAAAAAAPAFADDGWGWRERPEWRQHEWRQHEWREHQRYEHGPREHAWNERHTPPVVAVPSYGYHAPPAVYGRGPAYDR
jgi:hypothetical protein